jgi:hypothetical protein
MNADAEFDAITKCTPKGFADLSPFCRSSDRRLSAAIGGSILFSLWG